MSQPFADWKLSSLRSNDMTSQEVQFTMNTCVDTTALRGDVAAKMKSYVKCLLLTPLRGTGCVICICYRSMDRYWNINPALTQNWSSHRRIKTEGILQARSFWLHPTLKIWNVDVEKCSKWVRIIRVLCDVTQLFHSTEVNLCGSLFNIAAIIPSRLSIIFWYPCVLYFTGSSRFFMSLLEENICICNGLLAFVLLDIGLKRKENLYCLHYVSSVSKKKTHHLCADSICLIMSTLRHNYKDNFDLHQIYRKISIQQIKYIHLIRAFRFHITY